MVNAPIRDRLRVDPDRVDVTRIRQPGRAEEEVGALAPRREDHSSVVALSVWADPIPYEVLARFSMRVLRPLSRASG